MSKGVLLSILLLTAASAKAGTVNEGKRLVFYGFHSVELRKFLNSQSARTQNFIKKVGQISIEKTRVHLNAEDLGLLSGPNDPRLNQLGNAYGHDAQGNVYIRGTLAAYLVDEPGIKLFECNNIHNPGAVGFPGVTTSACLVK
jgi:hypothetical protein